jgi:2',3'-cyclic-nucleotide 2'-phosphodiesterase (5'-nucleotidase family)
MSTVVRRPLARAAVAFAVALFAAASLAGASYSHGKHSSAPKAHFTLTILHNNDGESKLVNAPGQPLYGGIARFATVVDNLRKEALKKPRGKGHAPKRGVVLLSSGDNFLAGPEFNASLTKGPPFYDSIGLDAIGYDAMALGNHEFDFGPETLADFIEGFDSPTPFLSSNLVFDDEPRLDALVREESRHCGRGGDDDDDDDDRGHRGKHDDDDDDDRGHKGKKGKKRFCGGFIAQSVIVKEAGEEIGVIGATTPLLPAISSPRNVEVLQDVAGEIQREINRLRRDDVDIVIVISHLQNVNEDIALAPMLRGVDVMIAGGGDELLANPGTLLVPGDPAPVRPYPIIATGGDGAQIPVVTTAGDYKYVGKLTVDFDKKGRVVTVHNGPVRVSGDPATPDAVAADPEIQAAVVDPVVASVADLAANVVATSEVSLDGRNPNPIRQREANLGNLMADALRWQGQQLAGSLGITPPNVGLQNGGGIRNNSVIPAGPLTELNTFAIAPFSNFVAVVPNIPPAQFKEILENLVQFSPGANGRFGHVSGVRFAYDATKTAQVVDNAGTVLTPGQRIQSVTLDDGTSIVAGGAVVAGAPSVTIATNDFSARGGDQYPFRGAPFTNVGVSYQQALLNYLTSPAGLNGVVTSAQYPAGGSGRITCIANCPPPAP